MTTPSVPGAPESSSGDIDAELILRIRRGDADAWDELIRKHQARLWSIARGIGLDRESAHDALQGTWLALLDHLDRIREPAAVGGWLATVLRHEAIRIGKKQRSQRERAERLAVQRTADSDSDEPARGQADDVRAVSIALDRLPERCRTMLRLMFSDELAYADIAELLDVPIGSLGPTRARCLDKLRRLLA